jgi:hypothetical protein
VNKERLLSINLKERNKERESVGKSEFSKFLVGMTHLESHRVSCNAIKMQSQTFAKHRPTI